MSRRLCRRVINEGRGLALVAVAVLLAVAVAIWPAKGPAGAEPVAPRPTATMVPQAEGEAALVAAAAGAANLVIESIEVSRQVPLVGEQVTVLVRVANRGTGYPKNADGVVANFWVDLFVNPPVSSAEDILRMPGYPPTLSAAVQSNWLPPGGSHVVPFTHSFAQSGMYDLYAVADIAELGLPYGNVYEGSAAAEEDNAFGPRTVEVRHPNVIVAKDSADFARGPGSSLALVPLPTAAVQSLAQELGAQATDLGNAALTLGYFEEPPYQWGLDDPVVPDYDVDYLDSRLNDDEGNRPQEWLRLAATESLLIAVWQDGRNSALTDWDVYLAWSTDKGATWSANAMVNTDGVGAGDQRRPAVAISPVDNRVLVVWQDRQTPSNPASKYRVAGRWFDLTDSGLVGHGSDFAISQAEQVNCLSPDVAAGPEGNFYVVWQDDTAGNNNIWLRAHSDETGWMTQPTRIADPRGLSNQRAPRVAAGRTEVLLEWAVVGCPSGSPLFRISYIEKDPVVVVWEDDRHGDFDIYGTYSIDQAQTFAVDFRLNDDQVGNGFAQRQPAVGVAQMWEAKVLDGTCPENNQAVTAVVGVPAAGFYYVWQDFRNSTNEAKDDDPDIYATVSAGTATSALFLDLAPRPNERLSPEEAVPSWQEYPAVSCRTYDGSLFVDQRARHNAFFVWADRGDHGRNNSDVYMAVRGDGGAALPPHWTGGAIPINSGAHATNLEGSAYLQYEPGDPPPAHQTRPAVAADIVRGLTEPAENDLWWHTGFVHVGWDDSRRGGVDRDIYYSRSNLTYAASYRFYPDPVVPGQLPVGPGGAYCKYGSGSYVSPIYDALSTDVTWDRIEWDAITPTGTLVTLQTRVGDDLANLGDWLPKRFPYAQMGLPDLGAPLQGYDAPGQYIEGFGGQTAPRGRYVQFRVNMWAWPAEGPTSGACGAPVDVTPTFYDPVMGSPVVYSVTLRYHGGPRQVLMPMVRR